MKTRQTLAIVVSFVLFAAAACVPHRGSSQEVTNDLKNYTVELQKWEEKEQAIFRALDDVEESQYVDDDFVARTLKGALPTLDEHIREVAVYQPATAELRGLHDHYRKGWEDLRAAFEAMIAAEMKKDYVALSKGKKQMIAARNTLVKSVASMNALMEEHEEAMKSARKS